MANHKGKKELSEQTIRKWWDALTWQKKEEICKCLSWGSLDNRDQSVVRKAYIKAHQ